ncbi:MAG: epoxyqueuosine reductase QueH [Eubacteriales bacterium]|nr:epoxyqueuosine reductase QueH [Eubacteriales bacterium]MDD4324073.1 epoxyqueuosine reductase QueH [Eubacteriales bacterium]MDD4541533.1 epoxyqueuosine reductase QueH [Eubacteriales bacterium]
MTKNKLLLHICCGPCAMAPLELLQAAERDCELFFFNPNIHPSVEWSRRLDNAVRAAEHYELPLHILPGIDVETWRERAADGKERCKFCYETRMMKTAEYAASNGFDSFSTSLLVSPYQDRKAIIRAGEVAAAAYGLEFEAYDWRDYYRHGQDLARDLGLYRQKYCGCIVSLEDSKFYEKICAEHARLI